MAQAFEAIFTNLENRMDAVFLRVFLCDFCFKLKMIHVQHVWDLSV